MDNLYAFKAWLKNQEMKTEDKTEKVMYTMMKCKISEFEWKLLEEELFELQK